ncbi:hypothetical protein BMR11_17300, partial [Methylococcaceae bacterium CS5]
CVGERITATGVPEFREVAWRACEAEHMIYLLLKLRIMIADNVGKGDLCDRTILLALAISAKVFSFFNTSSTSLLLNSAL